MDESPNKAPVKQPRPPRQAMPEQSPRRRAQNVEEVPKGYSPETAQLEASRCLDCKKPLCVAGCPVNIDIPGFVRLIKEGKFVEAAMKLKEQTALPAVCGRVCPQETQCEEKCVLTKKFESVAIGRLERFAADYARVQGNEPPPELAPPTGPANPSEADATGTSSFPPLFIDGAEITNSFFVQTASPSRVSQDERRTPRRRK